MKRQIIFRGKTKLGIWVYGMPTYDFRFIFNEESISSPDNYEVDPKTVGQFTGLTDKNGVKIFEGDSIKYYQPYSKKLEEGFVKWDDLWACFGIFKKISDEYCHESDWVKIHEIEVIGNIHDNTELL